MEFSSYVEHLRSGDRAKFPANANTIEYAQQMDRQDELRHFRNEFILPTKGSLKKKAINGTLPNGEQLTVNGETNGHSTSPSDDTPSIYFCGNSLGVQPKAARHYLNAQLETWASIAVGGHFSALEDSPLRCPRRSLS
ncbi:Kynureninase 1 like protein [Verticillium longisporum]|nr:Kynureninase 1 like protein [Verticillium longisporum]